MTDAECLLWRYLRNRALVTWKFRRQHPIGPYVADFVCLEAGVIVELDGGQHANSFTDATRTRYLQAYGYEVLRFWNHDVLLRRDDVLAAICHALDARTLTPTPLP